MQHSPRWKEISKSSLKMLDKQKHYSLKDWKPLIWILVSSRQFVVYCSADYHTATHR
jgi:hypothetical protein